MLVLHALWRDGALGIWGEDSATPGTVDGRRHPAAAGHDRLREEIETVHADPRAEVVAVRLPTRGGTPVDSPELIRDALPEQGRGAVTLREWSVPVLWVDPLDAVLVLADDAYDPEYATTAASLRHLTVVKEFAADLVRRGRLLPVLLLDAEPGVARAAWRPLLTGPDAAWAQALALALPPATRAVAAGPDDLTAAALIADALDSLVDAEARSRLNRSVPMKERIYGPQREWRARLGSDDPVLEGDPAELAEFAEGLGAWQSEALAGQVRAQFKLVEPADPEDPDEPWRVEFALQAVNQPSLVVDAERIWKPRSQLKALARYLEDPQETLLRELGRASRLFPELDQALRSATPAALELDGTAAHRFLAEGAPMLAGAGFGVLLPGWWSKPRGRLGVRINATAKTAPGTVATASGIGIDSLVKYEWQLALGDEPLTESELAALVSVNAPLVRLRGQWVELDAKRLAAGLKFLSTRGEMSIAELLHTGLSTEDGPGGLPVVSVTADGPLGDLLAGQVDRRLEPMTAPSTFSGVLRPYQERGLAWLAFLESLGLGGILADDMGLGKTVQILALLLRDRADAGPTLLVCPMSLVGNWQREAQKFAPGLRVHVHHGAERVKGAAFGKAVAQADLVVTTYAIAARDSEALAKIGWHRLVLDEAQAIKNSATRQAVAVRALPARHRIAVTGTPVENRLADLWSIMDFANPGLLGSALVFRSRYAEPVERRGDEAAAERLRRLTGPFVLRRVKTDKSIISDLPEKLEMEVLCNLTAEQASLYSAVVEDMLKRIDESEGIERRGLVLATMTKLKQVCNHPAQLLRDGSRLAGRSGKLARLEEILEEVLAVDEKALLFTQYAEFGGMLRAHLSARFGREVAFLHGGTSKVERDSLVARFQSDDPSAPSMFVLSLKAGGTGLTLTAANHVIHVDRWWNPAVEDQATDRAFRIGQKRNVQVRKFVCTGTMEEKIAAMINDKRGLAAKIVGTGEQWITEMSTSELRDLFALESAAVVE